MISEYGSVLLVDDDPAIRRTIKKYLQRNGIRAVDTGSAEEAWRIISAAPSQIELLITDLLMPGTSGRDLLQRVREAGYSFPVLVISGHFMEDGGCLAGAGCIRKPLDITAFLTRVAALIDNRMAA
jgi:two-component system, OmpR family, response regulator